jgi:hypothetical protein
LGGFGFNIAPTTGDPIGRAKLLDLRDANRALTENPRPCALRGHAKLDAFTSIKAVCCQLLAAVQMRDSAA